MKRKSRQGYGKYSGKRRRTGSKIKYRVQDRTSGIAPVRIKNSKAVKTKVIGKIKVSTALRAKIKKVIQNKQFAQGSYTDHFLGGGFQMASRQQVVFGAPSVTTAPTAWHFTLPMFLDVASQLFNSKAITNSGPGRYGLGATGNMNPKNLTFDIKNSYSTYTIKNGSQHAAHIIMCICVPKKKGSSQEWAPSALAGQTNDGGGLTVADAIIDPTFAWVNALVNDADNGMILPSFQPDKASITGAGSIQAPSVSDLFRLPSTSRTFNNMYKVEYVKFFLQPGQVVEHFMQGPKMVEVDFSKAYTNECLQNIQKYSRSVFFIGYNSPNSMASYNNTTNNLLNAVPGRWSDQIDNKDSGFPLYVERSDHYSLSLPDQVGFTFPVTIVAGNQQNLNSRISRSINNVWDVPAVPLAPTGEVKTVVDLSVMNPQQPVNDGNSDQA